MHPRLHRRHELLPDGGGPLFGHLTRLEHLGQLLLHRANIQCLFLVQRLHLRTLA